MNMFDNMAFPLREHTRKTEKEIREIVLAKADMVGMLDHMKKFPGEVSGGMKKRAGLARALAMDPEIILFDEPDSGLDPVRVSYLDELVKKIQEETGATFVIITHNIASVMRTSDYIAVLYRSGLVKFASKAGDADHRRTRSSASSSPAGPSGPIGMDELATEQSDIEKELVAREVAAPRGRGPQAADTTDILHGLSAPRDRQGPVRPPGDRQHVRHLPRGAPAHVRRAAAGGRSTCASAGSSPRSPASR